MRRSVAQPPRTQQQRPVAEEGKVDLDLVILDHPGFGV
jgi:hypothetical protein